MARKLFVKTYGCQMNVYDSGRMADALVPHGYALTDRADDADLVILNTCHIREKAAEKVYSELGRLQRLRHRRRAQGGDLLIGVAGCVAQAEGQALLERAPYVDLVVGPQAYHRLPELLHRRARSRNTALDTDFPLESKFDRLPEARAVAPGVCAFVTVQEGCDKFCTFCVVPYTRGAEASRPAAAVLAEARQLVAGGAREITLLGQNVNAYRGAGPQGEVFDLARLIRALAEIPGLARIRYTTSHPRDLEAPLIAAHREVAKLMPFLHLPVQSGSDRVLQAMNRRHRVDDYRQRVERLRRARPDMALSSDFIVGFPGETETDFRATLALVEEIGFAQAFSFKYSPRPGTPAATMRGQVKDQVKAERLAVLQELLAEQSRAFQAATVGRTLPVLLERPGRHPGQLVGRTPYLQAVHVSAPGAGPGDLIEVKITACHASQPRRPAAAHRGATRSRRMRLKPVPTLTVDIDTRTLRFDDNRLCALLFGQHHEHLALIEQQIPATLAARGNLVTVAGEAGAVEAASAVLEDLYRRLECGLELGRSEVEAAVRMVLHGAREPVGIAGDELLIRTDKRRVTPRSPNQAAFIRAMQRHDLVFGIGPAGTGKTYLAVATGLSLLRQRVVERLILSRPAVEAGERLGFLPGDMKDKVDPYLRPLYDALQDMLPEGKLGAKLESAQIEIAPLAFMRGRTLANAFVILDEGQNTTPNQMKMFLTRLGENSRMVVTGDPTQDDLPPGTISGLNDAVAKLDRVERIAVIRFTEQDIVRHPLVETILNAYRTGSEAGAPASRGLDDG